MQTHAIYTVSGTEKMGFRFDSEKTAQVAAQLITLCGSDRLEILKLMKLLYMVDREAYRRVGVPITGDRLIAMQYGPALSNAYTLLKVPADEPEQTGDETIWHSIFGRQGNLVILRTDPGTGRLSKFDKRVLSDVVNEHGRKPAAQLVNVTHEFYEWIKNDPGRSSKDIPLEDILVAVGRSEDIDTIEEFKREDMALAAFFAHTC